MKYFLLFALLPVSSCLSAQQIGQVSQGVSILEKGLWPGKTCEVCWENPSPANATERGWVRDAVQNTWEKESEFRFTGWGTCNAASRGIRILISNNVIDTPHTEALGAYLDGMTNGMVLNFNWNLCGEPGTEACIRPIAVHEFGHALGFAHEQNRTDAPLKCQERTQGKNGDWWVTGYDAESVMNYCNPKWNNFGSLSELDKFGVRFLYGGSGYMTDPVIYTLNSKNELLWYKHTGHGSGSAEWARNIGTKVGDGWDFNHIVNDGDGHIYAIRKNGELLWYNHVGFHDGAYRWSQNSGSIIGKNWSNEVRGVFAAGAGVIYMLKTNGDLLWYRHIGYQNGEYNWDAASGTKVGSGWTSFYAVFSGGNGVFYLVDKKGDLYWYKHAGVLTGSNKWYGGLTNKISSGWNTKSQVLSTGAGKIYSVNADGTLQYYNYQALNTGNTALDQSAGQLVGNAGWGKMEVIGMGSNNHDAIGNVKYQDNRITSDIQNPSATTAPDLAKYSVSSDKGNDARKQIIQTRARQLNWIEFKEYVYDGTQVQGALYRNGAIFIHNNAAFETYGAVFEKWKSLGGYAAIGTPTTNLNTCPDGAGQYTHFRHKTGWESSIYWNPRSRKAFWIHGAIRDFWMAEGWERGPSGYPTSDEKESNDPGFNRMQEFDKRQVYWSAKNGTKAVKYPTID